MKYMYDGVIVEFTGDDVREDEDGLYIKNVKIIDDGGYSGQELAEKAHQAVNMAVNEALSTMQNLNKK